MKEPELKLFMVLLGANPKGRNVEQHDYFFGIAATLRDLVPAFRSAWPESANTLHVDGWREVTAVDNHLITVIPKTAQKLPSVKRLFFINLGGYQSGKLEEQHYTLLTVQDDRIPAVKESMKSLFFKSNSSKGAHSHIDEKFGVDVDDFYRIEDILADVWKDKYHLDIRPGTDLPEDEIHLGYFKLDKIL